MSGTGFQIFSAAFPVGEEAVYAACLALFLRPFAAERGRRRKLLLVFTADLLVCLGAHAPLGPSA